MLLLFPVERLSPSAVRSLIVRYGDGDGHKAWIARRVPDVQPVPDYALESEVRMGLWRAFGELRRPDVLDAIAWQFDTADYGYRNGEDEPTPSDFGPGGFCMCGCGATPPGTGTMTIRVPASVLVRRGEPVALDATGRAVPATENASIIGIALEDYAGGTVAVAIGYLSGVRTTWSGDGMSASATLTLTRPLSVVAGSMRAVDDAEEPSP